MKKIEGVYVISNTMTINVYEVSITDEYKMLLGSSFENAEWCKPYFEEMESFVNYGELKIPLSEIERV